MSGRQDERTVEGPGSRRSNDLGARRPTRGPGPPSHTQETSRGVALQCVSRPPAPNPGPTLFSLDRHPSSKNTREVGEKFQSRCASSRGGLQLGPAGVSCAPAGAQGPSSTCRVPRSGAGSTVLCVSLGLHFSGRGKVR